ncbi:MAG: anti-sigma factor [Thermoanaerobaculia bacterium]|nr:anti-sigma factor [Thermoanaerobaculia bacterium]
MADDRLDPIRPGSARPAAELAAELVTWCDSLEAELDATEQNQPKELVELAPPPEVKERVLRSIRAEGRDEPVLPPATSSIAAATALPDRGLMTMIWALGVAASFMLAMAFGALWYATRADLGATRVNVAQLEALLHGKTRDLEEKERELAWLKDPRVQVALLKGLEANPAARARLLWNPGTREGILWVSGLPPLPLEKSYELWAFVGDQPVPAGTFDAKGDGTTVIPIGKQENLGEAPVKFAVSVEPKGGVASPTGAIVLVGERF